MATVRKKTNISWLFSKNTHIFNYPIIFSYLPPTDLQSHAVRSQGFLKKVLRLSEKCLCCPDPLFLLLQNEKSTQHMADGAEERSWVTSCHLGQLRIPSNTSSWQLASTISHMVAYRKFLIWFFPLIPHSTFSFYTLENSPSFNWNLTQKYQSAVHTESYTSDKMPDRPK